VQSVSLYVLAQAPAALGTGQYRLWMSETLVADAAPVSGDVELTQTLVPFPVSTSYGQLVLVTMFAWPRAALVVKTRIVAPAGFGVFATEIVISGGAVH
jgi:hypothetical protein